MAEERSNEWVLDFIKRHLPEGVRESFEKEDPANSDLVRSFYTMRDRFEKASPEANIEYACLSFVMIRLLSVYYKMSDEFGFRTFALETYLGINGMDIEDLKKEKKRHGFSLVK